MELAGKLGRMKLEIVLADEIVGIGIADIGGDGDVGDDETALGILDEEVVGDLVDHGAEQHALGLPVLLGVEVGGDARLQRLVGGDEPADLCLERVRLVRDRLLRPPVRHTPFPPMQRCMVAENCRATNAGIYRGKISP